MSGQLFNTDAEVSYNGIELQNIIKSKITATPVFGGQNVTVKYVKYKIEIEAIVTPDYVSSGYTDTDSAMENLRIKLSEPGKVFKYLGKGLGNDFHFDSGPDPSRIPLAYGPKPQTLVFETFGGDGGKSAHINWSVEVCSSDCLTGGSRYFYDFWSKSALSINKKGYQTLTRTGKIELHATFNYKAQASKYWKGYIAKLTDENSMPGFHLTTNVEFSPDDRVCTFTLTYTEIESPNAYPLGVVDISFTHKAASALMGGTYKSGFRSWENEANCRIELRPGVPATQAWNIFILIASQRIATDIQIETKTVDKKEVITKIRMPIILSMSLEEDVFSETSSFMITWVSYVKTIAEIINERGLFKSVIGPDWNSWTADIRSTTQNSRGVSPIYDHGNTVSFVDRCSTLNDIPDTKPIVEKHLPTLVAPSLFQVNVPTEEASYVSYENDFIVKVIPATTTHRRYPEPEQVNRSSASDNTSLQLYISPGINKEMDDEDYTVQDFGNDKIVVTMVGRAIRMGYSTPAPEITEFGGKQVRMIPEENIVSSRIISSSANIPVYQTRWSIGYEVLGYPSGDLDVNRITTGEKGQYGV